MNASTAVTLAQLQADLATEDADIDTLTTANAALVALAGQQNTTITSLQAQIAALQAAGAGATPADIAALDTTVNTDAAKINTLTAAVNAALQPPAPAPTAGT